MRVIGVNPVQRLIVPRFLAMLAIAPALCVMIIASGVGAGLAIAANVNDVVPASFWQSFGTFATPTDLMFSVLKAVLFAFIVVVIASCITVARTPDTPAEEPVIVAADNS